MIMGDDYSSGALEKIVLDHQVCISLVHAQRRKLRASRPILAKRTLCIVPSFRRFIRTIRHVIRQPAMGCKREKSRPLHSLATRWKRGRRGGGREAFLSPRREIREEREREKGSGKKFIRASPADTLISRQLPRDT